MRVQEEAIKDAFEDFEMNSINTAQFKERLTSMGLKITTDLEALLRKSECCDTPFGEVLRTLCVADHGNQPILGNMGIKSPQGGASSVQMADRRVRGGAVTKSEAMSHD